MTRRIVLTACSFLILMSLSIVLLAVTTDYDPGRMIISDSVRSEETNNDAVVGAPGVDGDSEEAVFELGEEAEFAGESEIVALAGKITAGIEDDYEKLVAVYDWVTGNIAYDTEKAKNVSAYGSGALYLLQTGKGVCHDYAELTKDLLEALGIEATYESGEVHISTDEMELHAWNKALVHGTWYALDTTWGAGYLIGDSAQFLQKPRSIYLTTPEELHMLHRYPLYKQKVEEEYMRVKSQEKPVIPLAGYEGDLIELYNRFRGSENLPLLVEETRLIDLTRGHAMRFAEAASEGKDYSLTRVKEDLELYARDLNIKEASLHSLVKWGYHPGESALFMEKITREQKLQLERSDWQAVSVGAVRKGEMVVFITIFISYLDR